MNRMDKNAGRELDRLLGRYANPSQERMKLAIDRVQESLRNVAEAEGHPAPLFIPRPRSWKQTSLVLAGAAVILVVAGIGSFFSKSIEVRAVVESTTGSFSRTSANKTSVVARGETIEAGDVVRTGDGTATARLTDGSHVELRSRTEFALERAHDGVRIHLFKGSVIVTAAKQDTGHLYVQTKDVIVSVVGTVFLVNAEEEGSRVAVIEGEVRVQQGSATKNLLTGQQLSTNPRMDPLPVDEEVSRSSNAPVQMALLQQSTASPARAETPRLKFEAASIRPVAPGAGPNGFACRGIDGMQRADAGETGNPGFIAPQGRCVGNGVSLARLITFAYRVPHRYGPQTPDWSKPYMNPLGERPRGSTMFQVSATAENAATVTLEQLRQMVQSMLAERFKLEFHLETQEVPIYALVMGNSGIKFKESSGDESLPAADFSTLASAGGPTLRGKSKISNLAQFVSAFINPIGFVTGDLASHVEDKTGLAGIYEYELVLPVPGGGSRGQNAAPPGAPEDTATRSFGWRAPAMADALEHQLGLRLQRQKISAEVLVVDKVDLPSEN